jgi:hypothetical protein
MSVEVLNSQMRWGVPVGDYSLWDDLVYLAEMSTFGRLARGIEDSRVVPEGMTRGTWTCVRRTLSSYELGWYFVLKTLLSAVGSKSPMTIQNSARLPSRISCKGWSLLQEGRPLDKRRTEREGCFLSDQSSVGKLEALQTCPGISCLHPKARTKRCLLKLPQPAMKLPEHLGTKSEIFFSALLNQGQRDYVPIVMESQEYCGDCMRSIELNCLMMINSVGRKSPIYT